MEAWLERALERLRPVSAGHGNEFRPEAWVEAGRTIETLAGHGGLAAVRSRTRIWAAAIWGPDRALGALSLAARTMDSLPEDGWAEQHDAGQAQSRVSARRPAQILFEGAAAADLVRQLAVSVHGSAVRPGADVGPGWCLEDDPADPEGLAGGDFDDAGFPASRRVLADGVRAVASLAGAGHLRRPSFRDPPEPMPTTLVVRGTAGESPVDPLRVRRFRLHRLTSRRWVLELAGGGLLETDPMDLVARCVSSVGPARRHSPSVVTPSLLFQW